jgi:hypothetical protein
VKLTLACVLLAVALPMVGAPGTTAFTENERLTVVAARKDPLPAWSALMEHVPVVTKVSVPPLVMVHTPVVVELKVTDRPDVAVAVSVGLVPKFCAPGLLNVMVCAAAGVIEFDAVDAELVPIAFVAVTVKV